MRRFLSSLVAPAAWLALAVGLITLVLAARRLALELPTVFEGGSRLGLSAFGFFVGLVVVQLAWSRLLPLER